VPEHEAVKRRSPPAQAPTVTVALIRYVHAPPDSCDRLGSVSSRDRLQELQHAGSWTRGSLPARRRAIFACHRAPPVPTRNDPGTSCDTTTPVTPSRPQPLDQPVDHVGVHGTSPEVVVVQQITWASPHGPRDPTRFFHPADSSAAAWSTSGKRFTSRGIRTRYRKLLVVITRLVVMPSGVLATLIESNSAPYGTRSHLGAAAGQLLASERRTCSPHDHVARSAAAGR